ncbi:MAG: NYN domain-containing protein [Lachnospiraceae bacterium]
MVYTRHGETADHYIERQCQQMPKYREARVGYQSDNVEQTVILGRGAHPSAPAGLWWELEPDPQPGSGSAPPQSASGASTTCRFAMPRAPQP